MKIITEFNFDIRYSSYFIKVEFYKTDEAFADPLNHLGECFNCVCAVDIDRSDMLKSINNILRVIETSVNVLLNHENHRDLT